MAVGFGVRERREAMCRYKAKLTQEDKARIRKRQSELRRTPEYRKKVNEKKRAFRATTAGKRKTREQLLRGKYGLTADQWRWIFIAQGRQCAICRSRKPRSQKGWSTDHCHKSGKVRGILCPACNKALGLFRENIIALQNAIEYLKESK